MTKRVFPWPVNKGGSGSGNFGHGGRPGEVGGSSEEGGAGGDKSGPKDLKENAKKIGQVLQSSARVPRVKVKGDQIHVKVFVDPKTEIESDAKEIFGQIKNSLPKNYIFLGGGIAKPDSSNDPIRADIRNYRFGPKQ